MEVMKSDEELFVPALPTLWPHMLFAPPKEASLPPFTGADARSFYFARNAIWQVAKALAGDSGGEVLVPAYHHGVEIEALMDAGLTPRFYRVGLRWDVDLEDVERQIGPQTRALYLTHYAGFPGPVKEMRRLADAHGLPLIEDCALSLLSSDGAKPLGTTGDVGVFCLYKTLPVPHGGMLLLNGKRFEGVLNPPMPPRLSTFSHTISALLQNMELRGGNVGRKLRAWVRAVGHGTVRAAQVERVATGTQHFNRAHVDLGLSALTRRIAQSQDLNDIVNVRRRNYFLLLGSLREVSAPLFSELPFGVCPLFYPLVVEDKDAVLSRLRAWGIETIDFWKHFHSACDAKQFPEVAQLRRSIVEIPCHQDLSPQVMARVAEVVREAVHGSAQRTSRTG